MVAMLYFVLGVTIATPIALAAIFIRRAYQEAARRKQQRLWREEFQAATGIQLPPNKVTPKSNDGGYDIFLSRGRLTAIAECKCYTLDHKIGRPAIQKLVGANMIKQASKMLFITTSSFSAPAESYAVETGVELVDGRRLLALVEKHLDRPAREQDRDPEQEYWLTREDLRKYIPSDIRF